MDLGNKIYEYRKKAGLSQEELGYKVNVTRQSVSLWETNQAQPSLENLICLSKLFNLSLDELCCNSSTQNTSQPCEDINTKKTLEVLSEEELPICKASITYNKEIYKKSIDLFYKKYIIIDLIILSILAINLIVSVISKSVKENWQSGGIPVIILLFIFVCVSFIATVRKKKKFVDNSVQNHQNFKSEYYFYDKNFKMIASSNSFNSTVSVNYNEIKNKAQDERYIYLFDPNRIVVIDKSTCEEIDKLESLLGLKKQDINNKKTENLLLGAFLLSLASIFIALIIVSILVGTSPTPDFPLAMPEYMWSFFLAVPIPVLSAVLGVVYLRKGFKCKKNIIGGIIVAAILCIYGSFTWIFADEISHDLSYLTDISSTINYELPTNGYISVTYDYDPIMESLAMLKLDKSEGNNFVGKINNDENWKGDINSIFFTDVISIDLTKEYDYFYLYENKAEAKMVFIAYDTETRILYICNYSNFNV